MADTMRITTAIETDTPIIIFFSVSSSGGLSEIGRTGSNSELIEIKGNPTDASPEVRFPEVC